MKTLRELLPTAIGCALLAYCSGGYPLGAALVPVLSLLPGIAVVLHGGGVRRLQSRLGWGPGRALPSAVHRPQRCRLLLA